MRWTRALRASSRTGRASRRRRGAAGRPAVRGRARGPARPAREAGGHAPRGRRERSGRHRLALRDAARLVVVEHARGEPREELLAGHRDVAALARVAPRADRRAAQRAQVRAAPERAAQVAREGPHVVAATAAQEQPAGGPRAVVSEPAGLVEEDAPRRQLEDLAAMGLPVGVSRRRRAGRTSAAAPGRASRRAPPGRPPGVRAPGRARRPSRPRSRAGRRCPSPRPRPPRPRIPSGTSCSRSTARVAWPSARTSRPEANGSSVPAWHTGSLRASAGRRRRGHLARQRRRWSARPACAAAAAPGCQASRWFWPSGGRQPRPRRTIR